MRLENDELKQQINKLSREKSELKKENEELQAAQSSTHCQSRQPVRTVHIICYTVYNIATGHAGF